jgi:hypothetical protein
MALAAQASPLPPAGRFGFARSERRSWVTMCPVVGDGDTVGVASDIVEDLGWPGKRPLRVDHPLGVPDRHQIPPERGRFMKMAVRGEKVQLPSGECLPQVSAGTSPGTFATAP